MISNSGVNTASSTFSAGRYPPYHGAVGGSSSPAASRRSTLNMSYDSPSRQTPPPRPSSSSSAPRPLSVSGNHSTTLATAVAAAAAAQQRIMTASEYFLRSSTSATDLPSLPGGAGPMPSTSAPHMIYGPPTSHAEAGHTLSRKRSGPGSGDSSDSGVSGGATTPLTSSVSTSLLRQVGSLSVDDVSAATPDAKRQRSPSPYASAARRDDSRVAAPVQQQPLSPRLSRVANSPVGSAPDEQVGAINRMLVPYSSNVAAAASAAMRVGMAASAPMSMDLGPVRSAAESLLLPLAMGIYAVRTVSGALLYAYGRPEGVPNSPRLTGLLSWADMYNARDLQRELERSVGNPHDAAHYGSRRTVFLAARPSSGMSTAVHMIARDRQINVLECRSCGALSPTWDADMVQLVTESAPCVLLMHRFDVRWNTQYRHDQLGRLYDRWAALEQLPLACWLVWVIDDPNAANVFPTYTSGALPPCLYEHSVDGWDAGDVSRVLRAMLQRRLVGVTAAYGQEIDNVSLHCDVLSSPGRIAALIACATAYGPLDPAGGSLQRALNEMRAQHARLGGVRMQ